MKLVKIISIVLISLGVLIPTIIISSDHIYELKEEENLQETTEETFKTISDNNYLGIIEIPKINLKRGFYDINSTLNNVDKNIYVLPISNFTNPLNIVLASHSGSGLHAYFKNLYKLEIDDEVSLYLDNKKYNFVITSIDTQDKDGTLALIKSDEDTLVLITCTYKNHETQTIYYATLTSITNV